MKNLAEFDYLKEREKSVETTISADQCVIARLDGNNFHNFTKGLKRPFDATFREAMADVTKKLIQQFGATEGFTQSDEITLIWRPRRNRNGLDWVEHPRSGRVLKLSTLMASYCGIEFYKLIHEYHSTKNYNGFDCRIYGGDEVTADDSLRFRFIDAASNAYQSIAQSIWSPKKLQGVSVQDIKNKLRDELKINVWQEYGDDAMLGVWFFKEEVVTTAPVSVFGNEGAITNKRFRVVRSNGAEMMKRINNANSLRNLE